MEEIGETRPVYVNVRKFAESIMEKLLDLICGEKILNLNHVDKFKRGDWSINMNRLISTGQPARCDYPIENMNKTIESPYEKEHEQNE